EVSARRAPAVREHLPGRHEPGGTATASGLKSRALPGMHPLLRAPLGGQARRHWLGPGPLRLRQQPRRRDREDAIRPLLHQAPLGPPRPPHPRRHCQDRLLRAGLTRRRCLPGGAGPESRAGSGGARGRRSRPRRLTAASPGARMSGDAIMSASDLADRIKNRTARVTVIGQGYVGLPLAAEFARAGFVVTGLDSDPDRVAALNLGQSHSPDVARPDLDAQLRAGRYAATSDFSALEKSAVVLISVPTPHRQSKEPDTSFVVSAAEEVAPRVRPGQLVILESTTYPGTPEELLLPMFQTRGARVGVDLFLAFSPERIDP